MATIITKSGVRAGVGLATLKAFHVRIPLRKTIKHASYTRRESENLVVECRLADGTVGYGEGVPREYVTGETVATGLELLRRTDWIGQLGSPRDFAGAVDVIRRLTLPTIANDQRGCQGNAARCAAELALLDAYGKCFGVSLHDLLLYLPDCASIYQPRAKIRYSGAITSKADLRERVSAWKVLLGCFHHCKVKVGTAGQDDVARLRRFRRIMGRGMDVRIDANEAWTPENVVEKVRALEPFGINAIEQPVPHEQVSCLREARRRIKTPVMLDESLCSRWDAERALADGTCDLFNIRLSKCGGMIPSLELALFATRNGLGFQLGCQVGETGLLSAAGRHFACNVRGTRWLEGSYDHHLVREWLTRTDITFGWGGVARPLLGPGLGVEVAPDRLASVRVAETILHG